MASHQEPAATCQPLEHAILEADLPAPVRSLDDGSPGQHVTVICKPQSQNYPAASWPNCCPIVR